MLSIMLSFDRSLLDLLYEVELLRLLKLLVPFEILWECLLQVREVSSFLGFYWILLVELGPCSLSFAKFLEGALMGLLLIKFRVFVDLFILILVNCLHFLQLFGVAQSRVQHPLIISHESHLPGETLIPMVLRFRVNVLPLLEGGGVRLISPRVVVDLWILPKVVEECSFLICGLVDLLESTGTVRYVSISAASVICIVHWFRVNVSQWLRWSLFCDYEWTYSKKTNLISQCVTRLTSVPSL